MRAIPQTQAQSQQRAVSNSTPSNAVRPAARHQANLMLHLQCTIGNQAVQRMVQPHAQARAVGWTHPAAAARVPALLQRAPADRSADVARSRRALEAAKAVAADLALEAGHPQINIGRAGGRKPRAIRRHTQRILAELETIANNPALSEAQRDAARGLHQQIEDLNNRVRAAEIERARAAGTPKAAERVANRARATFASAPTTTQHPKMTGSSPTTVAKVEGAAVKVEGAAAKIEGKIGQAETTIATIGSPAATARVARLGSFLLAAALPGPQDVLLLWLSFFGSLAEAKEQLRQESYAIGFSEGLAARLLGFPADEATKMLIKPVPRHGSVGEEVAGFSGVRGHATNAGTADGWVFAGRLTGPQRDAFRQEAFKAIAGKGHTIGPNFNLDDVVEVAAALKPIVEALLELAAEQEVKRQWARAAEQDRLRGRGWARP